MKFIGHRRMGYIKQESSFRQTVKTSGRRGRYLLRRRSTCGNCGRPTTWKRLRMTEEGKREKLAKEIV